MRRRLKQADIGIAMGISGTDVAKSAADMILTDDNFASIEAAVEEGRGIFDNLKKFIVWTLPTNVGESFVLLAAILLGTALPMLPVQLLWINMTAVTLLGTMLVFEPKEADLMDRPPRDPNQPILTFPLFMRTGFVSLLMLAGGFALFLWELQREGASLAEARTAVVNAIVMVEAFYLLNCRSLTRSIFALGIFSNVWVILGIGLIIAIQLLFTYAPVMNGLFHSAPIAGESWLRIVAVGAIAFAAVELEKWIRFRDVIFQSDTPDPMRLRRKRNSPIWRRVIVFFIGGVFLIIGIAMLVLPGPALLLIPLGLAILASEFRWARKWMATARQWLRGRSQRIRLKRRDEIMKLRIKRTNASAEAVVSHIARSQRDACA